jgi:hypothetical protein
MPQFQVRELAFLRVGGQGGEPLAVGVGKPQLSAGVMALFPDDDPHFRGPGGQVEETCDARDPRAVPDLPSPSSS